MAQHRRRIDYEAQLDISEYEENVDKKLKTIRERDEITQGKLKAKIERAKSHRERILVNI